VPKWCYAKFGLDDFCEAVKKMGIESVELLDPADWAVVKKHGLTCAVCNGPDSIDYGFNRVEHAFILPGQNFYEKKGKNSWKVAVKANTKKLTIGFLHYYVGTEIWSL
jgi:hypothetical protein